MSAGAPWSVKGIDPKAREVAKDLARRSGMTLGEWLNRVILEDDMPEEVSSEAAMPDRPQRSFAEPRLVSGAPVAARPDDFSRVAYALDRLTDRIEASETRTGLAISGVEHSVRQAVARIEAAEREHVAVATRFETAVDRVGSEQARMEERLRRMEAEPAGPRSAEALRVLEQSVTRVANHVYDGDARTREALTALESRLQRAEQADPAALIEQVVSRLGARLADAEARTADALQGLRGSLAALDARVGTVEGAGPTAAEQRLQALADTLSGQVEQARQEIARRLQSTSAGRVDERFAELAAQVAAAEQRSAQAIQRMGHEVLTMAEAVNRRLQTSEERSAEAIAQVGGEMARIAGAVEQRLGRAEQVQAEALERLGGEIGKITERLTERMIASERRAAQAIDDVGEQVARVTERIEQRNERASDDLAVRIRESEERTARLLEETRDRLEQRLAEAGQSRAEPPPAPSAAAFGPDLFSRAEPADDDEDLPPPVMERPSFREEPESHGFAPIPEPEEDLFGLDQPEPPARAEDPRPLSTREVIEQARAAARAATPAERPERLQARAKATWRTTGKTQPGMFGGLKPRAPNTTLQTALMVAGVAAFMTVGAAGVMLIEGPPESGPSLDQLANGSIHSAPRAAVALTPTPMGPMSPQPGENAALPEARRAPVGAPQAASDAFVESFLKAVQGLDAGQPGSLAKIKALADAGHAPAQTYLGQLYEGGDHGVVQNLTEARRWYQRAAQAGDTKGMYNLGLLYYRGLGGPQDLPGAVSWFRKAADRGVVNAQYNLGLIYQSASGVPLDYPEAYKWFSIAAASGDVAARESALALEKKLTPAQIAAAESLAGRFGNAGAARTSTRTVAQAQRILGRLGYYKGPADGAANDKLKLAVAAYQRDQGLAATGALDPSTVSRLSVFTR
ncbi:SEL1-like repeat protein [Phenylobacterium deserti]|uniref:Localization factor PodJS n=1 Tax=Phenylobacterium deserti TaxID=1914756 RepID=A0A328APB9_9CAUL|nr:SEL1-like repeat protein [Phenylobacterium deserti]RAK56800.1 Localization factor PodJS [Phenylobacterium deserti]